MKKLFAMLVILSSIVFSCFAEEFTSFLGIPFGTSLVDVFIEMENKGWNGSMVEDTVFSFTGKQYAGKDIESIMIIAPAQRLASVMISFKYGLDARAVMKALATKYELVDTNDGFYFTKDGSFTFFIEDNSIYIFSQEEIKYIESLVDESDI
jgi:hypothetical protein